MNQLLTTTQGSQERRESSVHPVRYTALPPFLYVFFLAPIMEKEELKQGRRKNEREDPASCTLQILKSKPDRKDIALEEK